MAHPRRTHVPGGIYLVSSVGERGQAIFADDGDRVALGEHVARVIGRCGARVHAFRWLEDELLLMLQVYAIALSGVMQRIASLHARRVNEKLGYKGSLFQHPFRAVLLQDSGSVLEAVAMIHRDPPSTWSSHRAYLGLERIPWLTTRLVLETLAADPSMQLDAYLAWVGREQAGRPTWRLRAQAQLHSRAARPYDAFVCWLKDRSLAAPLEQLIQAVARWFEVDAAAIQSSQTSPLLSLARALIVWNSMHNDMASLSELARRFKRSRSTLHETRETYRRRAAPLFELRLAQILEGPGITLAEVLLLIGAAPRQTHGAPH